MTDQTEVKSSILYIFLLTEVILAFLPRFAIASDRASSARHNRSFVYQGKIVRPNGSVPTGSMTVTAKVYSPEPSQCLLWAETQTITVTNGSFSMELGYSENRISGAAGGAASDIKQTFINNAGLIISGATCATGNSYTPSSTDDRLLAVTFVDQENTIEIGSLPIKSVPFAMQADEIGGYGLSNLAKISGVGSSVTYTPDEIQSLKDFLGGDVFWNMKSRVVKNVADPVAATDAANKQWVLSQITSGGGGSGSVTSVGFSAPGMFSVSGSPVTSSGTISLALSNQNANKIFAGPATGGAAAPTFRSLDAADLPITAGTGVTLATVSGNLQISASGSGGGTVANVSAAALPLSVTNGTTSPVISIAQANTTTAGYLTSTDWNTFNNKLGNSLATGLVYVGNASGAAVARNLSITDIKSTNTGNWFQASGACAAGQRLEYTSASDSVSCQAYSITSSQVSSALGFTPASSGSQWTTSGSNIYFNSGNVGVGTSSPTASVHVGSSGAAARSALKLDGSWFTGGSTTTTVPQFLIEPTGTSSTNWNVNGTALGINSATGFSGYLLDLQYAGNSVAHIDRYGIFSGSIGCGGYVCINKDNTDHFTAKSTSYVGLQILGYPYGGTQTADLTQWLNSSGSVIAGVSATGGSYFLGNVGIGTTTPSAALQVNSNSNFARFYDNSSNLVLQVSNTGVMNFNQGGFLVDPTNYAIYRGSTYSSSNDITFQDYGRIQINPNIPATSGRTAVVINNKTDISATAQALLEVQNNNTTRFSVMGSGNVGVGTTTPNDKLEVIGKIRATHVCAPDGTNCKDLTSNWGSGGSVTNVGVGGLPLSVTNSTSTPTISIAQANTSTAGYLSSTDWNTFNDKLGTALASGKIWIGNASGVAAAQSVSGDVTLSAAGAVAVTKLQGNAVSSTTLVVGDAGKVYKWDGTALTAGFFSIADLKKSDGTSQFASASCSAAQTLTWSAVTDSFTCSNISGLDAGAISSGTISSARLPASATFWQDGGSGKVYYNGGNVGVGTTSPSYPLEVRATGSVTALGIHSPSETPWAAQIYNDTYSTTNPVFSLLPRNSGAFAMGTDQGTDLSFYTNGYTNTRFTLNGTTGNATFSGTGTFQGTGTSSFAGPVTVSAGANPSAGLKISADTNNIGLANAAGTFKWYEYLSGNDLRFFDSADRMTLQSGGNVGIGTTTPGSKLSVAGTIESTSGGIKFPDGTTQTTAASGSGGVSGGASSTGGQLLGTYFTTTAATNNSIIFTGAANSLPSYSGGVLTLPSNTSYMVVEAWGGGGTGGTASTYSGAGGGGAGAYSQKIINSPSGTYYFTVGSAGNKSCFGTNSTACTSSTITANAGSAGNNGTDGSYSVGGTGGSATGGDVNIAGQAGSAGVFGQTGAGYGTGGAGGSSPYGGQGGASGNVGSSPGGGGSGGYPSNNAGVSGATGGFKVSVYASGLTSGSVATGSSGNLAYYNASSAAVSPTSVINISGSNVGIGTTSPTSKLEVSGTVSATSFSVGPEIVNASCSVTAGGTCTATATCPSGKNLLSGGYAVSWAAVTVMQSYPSSTSAWSCLFYSGSTLGPLYCYALCGKIQ